MPMMPRATSSRRRCPPDSVLTFAPATAAEPDEFEHVGGRARGAVAVGEHLHGLVHGQHAGVADLLQHDADAGAPAPARGAGVFAEHADLPGVPLPVALQNLDGRRLARPVGAEDREDLAVADVEVEIPHRGSAPVRLRQSPDVDGADCSGWSRRRTAGVGLGRRRLEFGQQLPQIGVGQLVRAAGPRRRRRPRGGRRRPRRRRAAQRRGSPAVRSRIRSASEFTLTPRRISSTGRSIENIAVDPDPEIHRHHRVQADVVEHVVGLRCRSRRSRRPRRRCAGRARRSAPAARPPRRPPPARRVPMPPIPLLGWRDSAVPRSANIGGSRPPSPAWRARLQSAVMATTLRRPLGDEPVEDARAHRRA